MIELQHFLDCVEANPCLRPLEMLDLLQFSQIISNRAGSFFRKRPLWVTSRALLRRVVADGASELLRPPAAPRGSAGHGSDRRLVRGRNVVRRASPELSRKPAAGRFCAGRCNLALNLQRISTCGKLAEEFLAQRI